MYVYIYIYILIMCMYVSIYIHICTLYCTWDFTPSVFNAKCMMGELSSDNDEAEDHSLRPNNFEKQTSLEIGAILHGIVVSQLKGASGKISQVVV